MENGNDIFSHSVTHHSMVVHEKTIRHTQIMEHFTMSLIIKYFNWSVLFKDLSVGKDRKLKTTDK